MAIDLYDDLCRCGGMYPDLSYSEAAGAGSAAVILGVAPQKTYASDSIPYFF